MFIRLCHESLCTLWLGLGRGSLLTECRASMKRWYRPGGHQNQGHLLLAQKGMLLRPLRADRRGVQAPTGPSVSAPTPP